MTSVILVLALSQLPGLIPKGALSSHPSSRPLPSILTMYPYLPCVHLNETTLSKSLFNKTLGGGIISPPARGRRGSQRSPSGLTKNSQVFIPSRKQRCEFKYYCQGNPLLRKTSNQNRKILKVKGDSPRTKQLPLKCDCLTRFPC